MSTFVGYWDAFMPAFTVETVAATGKPLPSQSGIRGTYVDFIADHWQTPGRGETLAVILKDRTAPNWCSIGRVLTTDLLAMGTFAGLSFDGQLPLDIELAWLPTYLHTIGPSIVNLRVTNHAHPTKSDRMIKNVTWTSIEAIQGMSWLASLWAAVNSDWFDYGCNMLVTAYEPEVISRIRWDDALSLKAFGETLAQAMGWIAPLDGNIGFFVGIPPESSLHTKLQTKPPSS
jgi:hypothetical protein